MKRTLKYLEWEDPLAWTESMKGGAWKQLISNEQKNFEAVVKTYTSPSEIKEIKMELSEAALDQRSEPFLVSNNVHIWDLGTLAVSWKWITTDKEHHSADCAVDKKDNVWDVVDTGDGKESYTLRYWPFEAEKPVWEISDVGPYVIVINNLCFFLEAKNSLWYYRLSCVNAKTGKSKQVLFEEKDPLYNLSMKRGENHTAYLIREDSGYQEAYFFHDANHLRKLPVGGFFVLGGGAPNDYLATEDRGTDNWKGHGPRLSRWILPRGYGIPESVWVDHGILITKQQGMRYMWHCSSREKPKLVYAGLTQIIMNQWGMFHQELVPKFIFKTPGSFAVHCIIEKDSEICTAPRLLSPFIPEYGKAHRYFAGNVPYILVKPAKKTATSLLVTGYGAYGAPSSYDTTRWLPLLNRGWAVVIALVRGGGDDTMEWADSARTWKRENAVEDFEKVIRAAQEKTSISAKHTVIYGRSAGGILIGAAAARQKGIELFAGLYGEVPYLDVLRTTTNPELPLTQMEYNEFGNPRERLEDLISIGRISPMEGIPKEGYPGLFALLRTGSNDKEVFAYEPVKWILRARGPHKDPNKILAFNEKEGHFVGGANGIENRAIDLALLLAWRKDGSFRLA